MILDELPARSRFWMRLDTLTPQVFVDFTPASARALALCCFLKLLDREKPGVPALDHGDCSILFFESTARDFLLGFFLVLPLLFRAAIKCTSRTSWPRCSRPCAAPPPRPPRSSRPRRRAPPRSTTTRRPRRRAASAPRRTSTQRDSRRDSCGSTMERSGMGCSSLICRALASAAWPPGSLPTTTLQS